VTGKTSSRDKSFSEQNWGATSRKYLVTIKKNLREGSFAKIAAKAQGIAKGRRGGKSSSGLQEAEASEVEEDERALLVDVSDDEGM
jgi:hypothetical protein